MLKMMLGLIARRPRPSHGRRRGHRRARRARPAADAAQGRHAVPERRAVRLDERVREPRLLRCSSAARTTSGDLRERVAEVLEMVGLPGTEALMPAELTGGMRKRVGAGARGGRGARDPALRRADHRPRPDQRAAHQRADPATARRAAGDLDRGHARPAERLLLSDRMAMLADRASSRWRTTDEFRASARPEVQRVPRRHADHSDAHGEQP